MIKKKKSKTTTTTKQLFIFKFNTMFVYKIALKKAFYCYCTHIVVQQRSTANKVSKTSPRATCFTTSGSLFCHQCLRTTAEHMCLVSGGLPGHVLRHRVPGLRALQGNKRLRKRHIPC